MVALRCVLNKRLKLLDHQVYNLLLFFVYEQMTCYGLVLVLELEEDVGQGHVRALENLSLVPSHNCSLLLIVIRRSLTSYQLGNGITIHFIRPLIDCFLHRRQSIDGRDFDLYQVVEPIVLTDKLFRMISCLFIGDL